MKKYREDGNQKIEKEYYLLETEILKTDSLTQNKISFIILFTLKEERRRFVIDHTIKFSFSPNEKIL
jgi:hypothetical protein